MKYLLHHLLMDAAQRMPSKTAVIHENKSINYSDLDETSDKLACHLVERGIKRGDRIGIYLNKSIPAIISIFGILKTGAMYVPIDPKAPKQRLLYIIRDCDIKALLSSKSNLKMAENLFTECVSLESIILTDQEVKPGELYDKRIITWERILQIDKKYMPNGHCIETDLAYILYTSGSTGVPKGVMISHLNAFTFLNWVQDTFRIKSSDRLSNHAPLHFDLSILDIFGAMNAAATVILVPEYISAFPIKLAEWIRTNRISIWYSVPSVLIMMILHGDLNSKKYPHLKNILYAGEVFPVKYLRQLTELIPNAEYYNLYGPTETNVITYFKVDRNRLNNNEPVPIGKACSNMDVFALMEDGTIVCEQNQEGELYARGSCVAQGYWGDTEKTNQNFILNPLQSNFKEKVYRTGDIVTMDKSGNYLYKGRRDHMIKSRGYRIELGEIETALYDHPNIKEVAVIAIPDDMIGHRIKAFILPRDKNKLNDSELRLYCGNKIPQYMIPDEFEIRQSLPKTSTGKIDRKTLSSV